jgi:SAM-dependent methyltransferase
MTSTCHLCGRDAAQPVSGLEALRGVSSDCRPWAAGAQLATCLACGCVQKVLDPAWHQDVARIYGGYDIYYQSGGVEQAVFDLSSGAASPRSARLLDELIATGRLPTSGRLLDIGCGNGALLRAASERLPGWRLAGTELDDRSRTAVEAIPGVENLYVGPVSEVPGRFDVISMVHVLEHLPSPGAFLQELIRRLTKEGILVIQLPEFLQNPFDLLIRDHCNHFTGETLAAFVANRGFEVLGLHRGWVPKEMTVLMRPKSRGVDPRVASDGPRFHTLGQAVACVQWLTDVRERAASFAEQPPFGLFGTSIAATWLASELERERVAFFVDEDANRIGRHHLGRPIYAPSSVPSNARLFIALPDPAGSAVADRLARMRPDVQIHTLPPVPGDGTPMQPV